MNEIKSFGIAKLHQEEAQAFFLHVYSILSVIKDQQFQEVLTNFKSKYDSFDLAMKSGGGKDLYTKLMKDADRACLIVYNGIVAQNRVMLKHYLSHIRENARKLKIIINRYSKPYSLSYMEKIGIYTNLSQDINEFDKMIHDDRPEEISESSKTVLDELHVKEWLEELNYLKDRLVETYSSRNEQKGTFIAGISSSSRKDADEAYRKMIKQFNAIVQLNGLKNLQTAINNMNALIDTERAIIASRDTKNANKGKDKPSDKPEDISDNKSDNIPK